MLMVTGTESAIVRLLMVEVTFSPIFIEFRVANSERYVRMKKEFSNFEF